MTDQDAISVKVDGQLLDSEAFGSFLECIVDQNLYIPDMFSLRFEDSNMELMNSSKFDIGKPVEISMTVDENSARLIKGEITAVEPVFAGDTANYLVVRGFNKLWRGYRGTKQRTFLKQKDQDILKKIGGEIGLSSTVDSTRTAHEYIAQDNQSSGEYLLERSQRIGLKVLSEGGEDLKVQKAEETSGTVDLKLGENLKSFEPRATAAHQVDKVTVKGWDAKQKKAIVATVSSSKTHPTIKIGSGIDVSKKAFGSAEITIVDQPVFDAGDAKAVAQGHLDRLNGSFVQSEGVAIGMPQIIPGKKVKLKGLGNKFSGDYMVTAAVHVYSNKVLETTFTVSGISTNTFAELLNRQEPMRRWHGVYPALVTNNNDPDNLGRVKVKFPWLDSDFESDWARVVAPDAGPERGFYWLPEIDDEVLVAFEHGDINKAYILGRLWNGKDKPPEPNSEVLSGGKVNQRIIKSRSGHTILFDDTSGSEMIKIFTKSKGDGHTITMDDPNKLLTIQSASGVKISIDGKSGTMEIETNSDISIKSKANIKIESKGNMNLKATGNLGMEATGNVKIKGIQVTVEGTAKATLKAPTVSVNGSAMTEIKGGLVKIN